jgi:hypothetical protein
MQRFLLFSLPALFVSNISKWALQQSFKLLIKQRPHQRNKCFKGHRNHWVSPYNSPSYKNKRLSTGRSNHKPTIPLRELSNNFYDNESEIGQSVFKTLTPYERDYHSFIHSFHPLQFICRKNLLKQNQRALERQNLAHLNKEWDS